MLIQETLFYELTKILKQLSNFKQGYNLYGLAKTNDACMPIPYVPPKQMPIVLKGTKLIPLPYEGPQPKIILYVGTETNTMGVCCN